MEQPQNPPHNAEELFARGYNCSQSVFAVYAPRLGVDFETALKLAARAYVLEVGVMVKEGRAADLLADPSVREAYLGG